MKLQTLVIAFLFVNVESKICSQGGKIFEIGISPQGKEDVVNAHNKYRLDIANGKVNNQPRGVNLLRMVFDKTLSEKARVVSNQCKMSHVIISDVRWPAVGQNLFIEYNSADTEGQNWTKAVKLWFDENKYFKYPNKNIKREVVGHYTQVVWATSKYLGCDFIKYYDASEPMYPYAKLYTCNYGPAGNYIGEAPYKTGKNGCENLC